MPTVTYQVMNTRETNVFRKFSAHMRMLTATSFGMVRLQCIRPAMALVAERYARFGYKSDDLVLVFLLDIDAPCTAR